MYCDDRHHRPSGKLASIPLDAFPVADQSVSPGRTKITVTARTVDQKLR
jgi:hypothetical protein